ncbi:MAG: hypothetical protein K1X31_08895 [Gemmatimonadaceae bacterium]|nr:hypothetical protein [Gemmatimonadaceae bacterium]
MPAPLLLPLAVAALLTVAHPPAEAGEELLRRMNAAHRDRWFTTLIFEQRTTFPGSSRPEETWYETMERPGKLRLDMMRGDSLIGRTIFRGDSIYQSMGGRPAVARALVHPLLVLLHDVHVGPVDPVLAKLRALGFDLAKTRADIWQGRPVTVVGAAAGDTLSRQFWVDDRDLVVVRILQPGASGARSDTQVGGFSREGDALVEREIRFFTNGTETLREEYVWVRTGVPIEASAFDPTSSGMPAWVTERRRRQ